jgi:tRNA G18 (ribose-2'-O)-methylase SpoU
MHQPNGVPPHSIPWPDDPRFDPALLANGDSRNVLDKYRYWTIEAIRADLALARSTLHVAIENWLHDLNIGSIVRTANAFNVGGVHIIGKRHWNKRGAMVTDRYVDVFHHPGVDDFVQAMRASGLEIISIDNLDGAEPLHTAHLPEHCVLVFGSEGPGISDELRQAASRMVFIEQQGSTRSINASAAAAIVMYEWQSRHTLS